MLECPQCGHDNELGRIFCSKCGLKLDIRKIGAPSGVRRMAQKGQKPVAFGKQVSAVFGKIFKLLLVAVTAAMLTLVVLPANVERKPFTFQNYEAYEEKHSQLEDAMNGTQKTQLAFDESELNARMAEVVSNTIKAAGETPGLRLEAIYLSLGKGSVLVVVQQKWKWFHLTAQMEGKPEQIEGKWQFRGGQTWVGRFPLPLWLPPQAQDALGRIFAGLWKGFEVERQWIEQFDQVMIEPGKVTLSTKAAS